MIIPIMYNKFKLFASTSTHHKWKMLAYQYHVYEYVYVLRFRMYRLSERNSLIRHIAYYDSYIKYKY